MIALSLCEQSKHLCGEALDFEVGRLLILKSKFTKFSFPSSDCPGSCILANASLSLATVTLFVHGHLAVGFLDGEAGAVLVVEILDELLLQGLQAPELERVMKSFV